MANGRVGSPPTPLIIGVTSHRNIPACEAEAIRRRVRDFFARLRREYPQLPLVVLSSLAEGGDQWVAEEAIAARIRLIAPLPLRRAEYALDFDEGAARERYESLCGAAERIELPLLGSDDRVARRNDAPSGHERDLHYLQAGVFISQHCHILLAIWDGKTNERTGGTAQIVRFHMTGIRPPPGERRRGTARSALLGDDDRLAFHIVCSRDEPDGAPAPTLQPLQTFWRSGDTMLPGDAPVPGDFDAMLLHAAEFNADWAKYSERITAYPQAPESGEHAIVAPILRLFAAADWLAIHFQRRVLLSMRTLYTLAALMGIAFTAYDNLPAQDDMIFVFLLLFATGTVIVVIANRRSWHRKYLDYRALAEGLRVQSYWRRAGLSIIGDSEFAHDNFLQKQDVELGWIRNVMRGAALESALGAAPPEAGDLPNVIREWVGAPGRGGQLDYYSGKSALRSRTHRFTEMIGYASLLVGIGIAIVLALLARYMTADTKNWLVIVMGVFSIVAAVREAYAYKKADKELIKQYRYMGQLFAAARKALDQTADIREQREILRLLGEAALAEHVEWALMHRERPLEHGRI